MAWRPHLYTQHITKMQTLRERLAQHFAELLPERDDA